MAEVVSRPTYINCPKDIILDRLQGKYDYGDGRKEQDPNYMIFSERNCNFPPKTFGYWWLSQFRRWGMVKGDAELQADRRTRCMRPGPLSRSHEGNGRQSHGDRHAAGEAGRWHFRSEEPEKYAKSFPIHNVVA